MGKVLTFAPRPRIAGTATDYELQLIAAGRATHSALNITTPRTVQAGYGMLCRVFVIAMPSTPIRIYDARTVAEAGPKCQLMTCEIMPPLGVIEINWPCQYGITIDPGEGGHLTCSFN